MPENEEHPVRGTLLKGTDRSMYFIPEIRLRDFQLSEAESARAQRLVDGGAEVQGFNYTPSQLIIVSDVVFIGANTIGGNPADTFTTPFKGWG